MEIYKRPQGILIFFLVFLISCGYNKKESANEVLESENLALNIQAKRQQELLKGWFDDFQSVQKEIFTINTNELLLLDIQLEGPEKLKTDRKIIIEKVKKIKTLLKLKDDELLELKTRIQKIGKGSTYFEKIIQDFENEVYNLESEISLKKYQLDELQNKYNTALYQNDSLKLEIQLSLNEIETLQNENNQLKEELNEKFMIIIAKKEMDIRPVPSDNIRLEYKINNIELLSNHPRATYGLMKNGKSTDLIIYNSERFYNESNFIIIRIKSRKLN